MRTSDFSKFKNIPRILVPKIGQESPVVPLTQEKQITKKKKKKTHRVQLKPINHIKRAQRGLYHGSTIKFGNWISFSDKKTKRNWKPNIHTIQFFSDLLKKSIKIRVSSKALRSIDKMGGIDTYLLGTKPKTIDSAFGMKLRQEIIKKWQIINKEKFNGSAFRFKYRIQNYHERKARPKTKPV